MANDLGGFAMEWTKGHFILFVAGHRCENGDAHVDSQFSADTDNVLEALSALQRHLNAVIEAARARLAGGVH